MSNTAGETRQVPYPKRFYNIAAVACLTIGVLVVKHSAHLFIDVGDRWAGIGMAVVGLLWAVISWITIKLKEAHHGD